MTDNQKPNSIKSTSKNSFIQRKGNESPHAQVTRVIEQLETNPELKVGLIFSCNKDQADAIHNGSYQIEGNGQAKFFKLLAKALNEENNKHLQERVKTLPIATSLHGGDNVAGNKVNANDIHRDMTAIQKAIHEDGFEVHCFMNDDEYAIGCGVSKEWDKEYEIKSDAVIYNSQKEYVDYLLDDIHFNSPSHRKNCEIIDEKAIKNKFALSGHQALDGKANDVVDAIFEAYTHHAITDSQKDAMLDSLNTCLQNPAQKESLRTLKTTTEALPSSGRNTVNKFIGYVRKYAGSLLNFSLFGQKQQSKGNTQINQAASIDNLASNFSEFKKELQTFKEQRQDSLQEPQNTTDDKLSNHEEISLSTNSL